MIYVVSDINGDFQKYKQLFTKVKDSDTLFVLGNILDYGPDGIKILQDMMYRENVYPVLGEQEFMATPILTKLVEDVSPKALTSQGDKFKSDMLRWFENGGSDTFTAFKKLSLDDRESVVEYLEEFLHFEEVTVKNKDYILVSFGINNFSPEKSLLKYKPEDFVTEPLDYSKVYFDDITLISGGTVVTEIPQNNTDSTYAGNNHIAVNLGNRFSDKLGLYCIDNGRTFTF